MLIVFNTLYFLRDLRVEGKMRNFAAKHHYERTNKDKT